jgi:hypothetical protein
MKYTLFFKNLVILFFSVTISAQSDRQLKWILQPQSTMKPIGKASKVSFLMQEKKNVVKIMADGTKKNLQFDSISNINEDWSEVWQNGLQGIYNTNKGLVVPCLYQTVELASIQSDCWAFQVRKYGRSAVVNEQNVMIVPWRSEHLSDFLLVGDMMEFVTKKGYNFTKMGFASKNGSETTEEMLQKQKKGDFRKVKPDKYIFSCMRNGTIYKDSFAQASPFINDISLVKKDSLFGFLRSDGSWLIEPKLQSSGNFDAFDHAIAKAKGKMGVLRQNGTWLIAPKYEELIGFQANSMLFQYKEGNKIGLIDTLGATLLAAGAYQKLVCNGLGSFGVLMADSILIYNQKGQILPLGKAFSYEANNDLAVISSKIKVEKNQEIKIHGVVFSETGKWLLPQIFTGFLKVTNHYILVETKTQKEGVFKGIEKNEMNKFLLFNRKGEQIVQEKIDALPTFFNIPCSVFKIKDKFGLVLGDKVYLEPIYDAISISADKWILVRQGDKTGLLRYD